MGERSAKRVPRGTLSRERVVEAAVALADEEGVAGLSMPKVARRLGVGVMSLYGHVESKEDLLDAVAQELLGTLTDETDPGSTGVDAVIGHVRALRRLLVHHPGLGELFAARGVTVPAVFDLVEQNLTQLRQAGFDEHDAVRVYYSLLTYTLGFTSWELPRAALGEDAYRRRWHGVVDALPENEYPSLHACVEPLATVASDDQFEFGLRRLLQPFSDG